MRNAMALAMIMGLFLLMNGVFADENRERGERENKENREFRQDAENEGRGYDWLRGQFKELFPEMIAHLTQLRQHEEERDWIEEFHDENLDELAEMLEVKRREPKEYERWLDQKRLEFGTIILGAKIHAAQRGVDKVGAADLAAMEKRLRKTLEKLFDQRIENREREVKMLEREVKELRSLIKKREENRAFIIEKRFRELTGQEETMAW